MHRTVVAGIGGALAAALLAAAPAHTAQIEQLSETFNLNAGSPLLSGVPVNLFATTGFSFNGFDSSLGTLNSVSLSLKALHQVDLSFQVGNDSHTFGLVRAMGGGSAAFELSAPGVGSQSVSEFDLSAKCSGEQLCSAFDHEQRYLQFDRTLTGAAVLGYVDQASIQVDLIGNVDVEALGEYGGLCDGWRLCWLKDAFHDAWVSYEGEGGVVLTYDYTAAPIGGVPEPATWALMIGGFSLAGGALRRRRAAAD